MSSFVGKRVGNYQLTRLLGRGGFADVYLGEHIHLKMEAALKLIYGKLDSSAVEKFIREAQIIADLRHPHIVRILEFGFEHQQPFFVMDYAQNGTLRERHPRNSCVDLPTIVSYVKQVASALAYIHANKLIHRDIKPENMLLDKDGNVLLSDFGIVTVAQTTASMEPRQGSGTVYYMAPEQIKGLPRLASDQYSLAVVVYEWITGTRPFSGSSYAEVVMKHLSELPLSLRKKDPTLSPQVEQVVLKALSKDPLQRFPTIQDFSTALEEACLPSLSSDSGMVMDLTPSGLLSIPGLETGSRERFSGPSLKPDEPVPILEPSSQDPRQESSKLKQIPEPSSQVSIQEPVCTSISTQMVTTSSLLGRFRRKKTLALTILGLVICLVGSSTWQMWGLVSHAHQEPISPSLRRNTPTSADHVGSLLSTQVARTLTVQPMSTVQSTITAQLTPMPQPTPTAQLTLPHLKIEDNLDNWSNIYEKTSYLTIVHDRSDHFAGDTSRAYPHDTIHIHEYIVWHLQGMSYFQAIVYFYYAATKNHFNIYTSLDGQGGWIQQNPLIDEPLSGSSWQRSKYTLSNLSNANYIKLEWNNVYGQEWPPQVSSVTFSS